jgi:phosphoglycolate phosphatase-like HAD superfamily hydrolase
VIRGIFFDLDGTIIDSFQPITTALNLARAHYGMPPLPVEEAKRYIGGGVERLIREGIGESFVEAGVPLFRSFYAGVHLQETTLFPGVSDTLQALSETGYYLGVATNKPLRFAMEVLDHLDVLKYLPHVIGPERVTHRKPHREMLDWLMQRTGIRASETLYVGDEPGHRLRPPGRGQRLGCDHRMFFSCGTHGSETGYYSGKLRADPPAAGSSPQRAVRRRFLDIKNLKNSYLRKKNKNP